jgi:hypothetical protein
MHSSSESTPEPAVLRAELAALGDEARKVVGGLVVVMMREPERVRDREWLLENYTLLASEALGLGDGRLDELQTFVLAQRDAVLNATMRLFLRVAADLSGLGGESTLGQATIIALSYFETASEPS